MPVSTGVAYAIEQSLVQNRRFEVDDDGHFDLKSEVDQDHLVILGDDRTRLVKLLVDTAESEGRHVIDMFRQAVINGLQESNSEPHAINGGATIRAESFMHIVQRSSDLVDLRAQERRTQDLEQSFEPVPLTESLENLTSAADLARDLEESDAPAVVWGIS